MQSKKQRILSLLEKTDLANGEIAKVVDCHEAYVRTVQQRLLHGGDTPSQRNWKANNRDRMREVDRRWKAANRAKCAENMRRWREKQKLARALEAA